MFPVYEDFHRSSDYFKIFKSVNINFIHHLHKEYEAVFVLDGELTFFLGDKEYRLQGGDFALSPVNSIHGYKSENSTCYIMVFSPSYVPQVNSILKHKQFSEPVIDSHKLSGEIPAIVHSLYDGKTKSRFVVKGLLYQLFGELMAINLLVDVDPSLHDDLLKQAIEMITENYHENFSLDAIAEHLNISKYYLSRIFNKKLNCSIPDYCNWLKIEDAKHLLNNSESSILDISLNCGFDSLRTFNRVFKKITQKTPGEYRKSF